MFYLWNRAIQENVSVRLRVVDNVLIHDANFDASKCLGLALPHTRLAITCSDIGKFVSLEGFLCNTNTVPCGSLRDFRRRQYHHVLVTADGVART